MLLAAAVAAGGSVRADAGGAAAAPAPKPPALRLVDDWGRSVALAGPPQRIVSMAPHATELLFAAGAGPRVVAVDRSSDFPAEVRALPRLAAHPRPDPERLLAMRPDLVVLWGAAVGRDLVDRLEGFGVRVFVSEPKGLDDVAGTLERFALLGDDPRRGRDEARSFRQAVAALRARHAAGALVPVFVQVWARPLITLSDRDSFADVLRTCGARNVFGAERMAAPQVGAEAVLRLAPRLVVAFGGERAEAARDTWTRLGLLAPDGPAGFVQLSGAIQRPTPRMLAPMKLLCEAVEATRSGLPPAAGR
ncbi:helical backbone metal receptor [Quisquiliibacterium transsilvanicum]|uniref:Iron complex transport system substrate-binding protein n=1 Tax=Quisquiliibacterium transsilvanicum TaxID=1549638 RepID=A0A7W8HFA6_9BURK|nr:helical backbone metal receptor [Quisquiliibacterium transsilvanicum]MBB5270946.1 iron complex transport system substrate-binding protein [Quisquiliibacterium transsilvanicum]